MRVDVLVHDFGPTIVCAESIFCLEGDVISLIIKFRLDEHFHRDRLVETLLLMRHSKS